LKFGDEGKPFKVQFSNLQLTDPSITKEKWITNMKQIQGGKVVDKGNNLFQYNGQQPLVLKTKKSAFEIQRGQFFMVTD
jgi:hypothetical protein